MHIRNGVETELSLSFGAPRYHGHQNAYLVYGRYFDESKAVKRGDYENAPPQLLWWLYPDGRVEEIHRQAGPWYAGGSLAIRSTKAGLFLAFLGGMTSSRNPGHQGGYLVSESSVVKVIDGPTNSPVVSPDGCKVAFTHAPSNQESSKRSLKVINVCEVR